MRMTFRQRSYFIVMSAITLWIALSITNATGLETGDPLIENLREPWRGDLDGMRERRFVRVLIPYSKTFYYVDGGAIRGITAELLREFEKHLNKGRKDKDRTIIIKLIPTPRHELLSDLVDGRGDISIGNITVTSTREKTVAFSDPFLTDIKEFVITAENVAPINTLTDLAGREIHVRKESSYFESVLLANKKLKERGAKPMSIVEAPPALEDEDLIEMVQAELVPAIVVDSHKADFWKQVFPKIRVNKDVPLRQDADIAWAFRKDSPLLAEQINGFVKVARKGTSIGNTLLRRYSKSTKWLSATTALKNSERLTEYENLFRTYGAKYRIDWALVAAISFQESKFDQSRRNPSGAVGLMQIKPSTAADPNIDIKDVTDDPDKNVHAGVKYIRFIADQYFADKEIDDLNRIFLALGAYNAGPNRVAAAREKAENPNVWFGHVEWAVAARAGYEPVKYVSNIYKYYVLFKRTNDARTNASDN